MVVVDQVGCVAAVVWTVEGQGDPVASVEAEVWIVGGSEEDAAWIEVVLEEGVEEGPPMDDMGRRGRGMGPPGKMDMK